MISASPTTYGLLGMLSVRPWTGYDLTRQVRRSLRFAWPLSEGHLYREQTRLVALGWATVKKERSGGRQRNRYAITAAGRSALVEWLATEPEEPHFQIEGILRTFFADQSSPEHLANSMRSTATMARSMGEELAGFVLEYLEEGGPLSMLEQGVGGPDDERLEFHGRPVFPERLHVVALTVDVLTQLLETLEHFFAEAAETVDAWPDTTDVSLTSATRSRLERIVTRAGRSPESDSP